MTNSISHHKVLMSTIKTVKPHSVASILTAQNMILPMMNPRYSMRASSKKDSLPPADFTLIIKMCDELPLDMSPHRKFLFVPQACDESNHTYVIPKQHPVYRWLDKQCNASFGRGYNKPSARWYRNHNHAAFAFRERSDAAKFRILFDGVTVERSGGLFNGENF